MEEIRKYKCLYDRFSKEYKDKYKKINAWIAVSNKFGLTPSTVETRLKNIRTAYRRWLKKMKTMPSGSGRDAVPPLEFAKLDWLQSHIGHRPTTTNMQRPASPLGTPSIPSPSASQDCEGDELEDAEIQRECYKLLPILQSSCRLYTRGIMRVEVCDRK